MQINVSSANKGTVLFDTDTVVREAAVQTIKAITDKVGNKARKAIHLEPLPDEVSPEYYERKAGELEEALTYAMSALRGIDTALSLGRGGYVAQDGDTSLYFYGTMEGAVIDRDDTFSTHT